MAAIAGGLHSLAVANTSLWWLQLLSVAWLAARTSVLQPAAAARLGQLFGWAWLASSLWWLFISFVVTRLRKRISEAVFDRINRWTGILIAAFGFALVMDVVF